MAADLSLVSQPLGSSDVLFRELGSPDTLMEPDGQGWFFRTGPKWYMEKWLKDGSKFLKVLDKHVREQKK